MGVMVPTTVDDVVAALRAHPDAVVLVGKRLATVTAALRQGDRELIRVLATCGSPGEEPPVLVDGAPPELPPYDQCAVDDSTTDPDGPPALGVAMPPPGLMERLAVRVRPGDDAFRERSIEAEERREEAVVSKEARVVEEIGLRKARETETKTVSDTVRRTEVEIETDADDTVTRR